MAIDFNFETEVENDFDINTLTEVEVNECKNIANRRVAEQLDDANNGDVRATNSYGGREEVSNRGVGLRIEDAYIGSLAECIGSKFTKCSWSKEMGQYKGNKKPDLQPMFRHQVLKCEVRGSRGENIPHRPHQDVHKLDSICVAVTNLPNGRFCKVGWMSFMEMQTLAGKHPEWKGRKEGALYYAIPFEYFYRDFSKFGN